MFGIVIITKKNCCWNKMTNEQKEKVIENDATAYEEATECLFRIRIKWGCLQPGKTMFSKQPQ